MMEGTTLGTMRIESWIWSESVQTESTKSGAQSSSRVLGANVMLQELWRAPESRILEVEGAGSDSNAPRSLLTVSTTLGNSE